MSIKVAVGYRRIAFDEVTEFTREQYKYIFVSGRFLGLGRKIPRSSVAKAWRKRGTGVA